MSELRAYYNEFDKNAAAWLRELIARGLIAPGDVDTRSIEDVRPSDLDGYTQCHFFAGIGVWSYALRAAGWRDEWPIWTGSCPCQPFSAAGKGDGFDDERHLWPAWHWLIEQCRPAIVLGEQVASKDGLGWLDLVHADMEAAGYAIGAADLCAAGVGAPHIRQRLWIVAKRLADDERFGWKRWEGCERPAGKDSAKRREGAPDTERECDAGGLADANDAGSQVRREPGCKRAVEQLVGPRGLAGGMADTGHGARQRGEPRSTQRGLPPRLEENAAVRPGPTNGFWRDADWLYCRDDKWRPVEPGSFPLADGAPARVVRLRGYGNAINAEAARIFIEAALAEELGIADQIEGIGTERSHQIQLNLFGER